MTHNAAVSLGGRFLAGLAVERTPLATVAADGDQQAGNDLSVACPRVLARLCPRIRPTGSRADASHPMPIVAAKLVKPGERGD